LEDIPPVHYTSRYDIGGDEDYHGYYDSDEVYDSQGADYDDGDLYTL
jgi:hypothetical protein